MAEKQSDVLYDLYMDMHTNNLHIIYEGDFNQDITKHVLRITEKSIDPDRISIGVRKKIFNIMIEALQNICKHQHVAASSDSSDYQPAIFMIGISADSYFIVTGNQILTETAPLLQARIEQINSQDSDGLKKMYKEARLKSTISEVGGAGLGLIDIARKSGNKLMYRFDQKSERTMFFSLMTTISTQEEER